MGQDKGQVGTAVKNGTDQKSADEIRAEIQETRQDLGDTAAALAAKTDVKARAKEKVAGAREKVDERVESVKQTGVGQTAKENPIPVAAIATFVGGFLLGRLTARS